MQNEVSVVIDRPIEEVFDYTHNHVAEWSLTVVEDEVLEEKPEGVGMTFRVVTEDHGRRMEFEGVVTRHEPPRFSSVTLNGKSFDIETEYSFEDLSGRTRVTQRATVNAKGFFRVLLFFLGTFMKRSSCNALESELVNLKRQLESRESRSAG